jgi:hypothetical protein
MPGAFVASGRAEIALHQIQELMALMAVPGLRSSVRFQEISKELFCFLRASLPEVRARMRVASYLAF